MKKEENEIKADKKQETKTEIDAKTEENQSEGE